MEEQPLGQQIQEVFGEWRPPILGERAARWIVSHLTPDGFFSLMRLAEEQEEGRAALSGFRLRPDAVRRPAVREALEARLIGVLLTCEIVRAGLFFVSFPDARWYRWAEVLAAHDESWLLKNWRALLRATADPALAVALILDDRLSLAARGERLARTMRVWSGGLAPEPALLPEAWRNWQGLFLEDAPRATGSVGESPLEKAEARAAELERRLRQAEREFARHFKAEERWESRRAKLKAELADRQARIRELNADMKTLRRRASALEADFAAEVGARVAEAYADLCKGDRGLEAILGDALGGHAISLEERVESALSSQARLDFRYGTQSAVRARLGELEGRLQAVEHALADAIVPAQVLVRMREELRGEISRWRERLPAEERPEFPLAAALLSEARILPVNQEGLSGLERLLEDLHRPPLERLLAAEERDTLSQRLGELLDERRKIWQGREIAGRPPVRVEHFRVEEIADLSAFVFRHKEVCAQGIILVDGYNVIKSSAEWAALERRDFQGARGRFCDLWERRSMDWHQVEVVFDGQEDHMHVGERGRLSVVFTDDRAATQRADLYIAARIQQLHAKETDRKRFLVTADQALRAAVVEWCDYFIEPRWALIRYLVARD